MFHSTSLLFPPPFPHRTRTTRLVRFEIVQFPARLIVHVPYSYLDNAKALLCCTQAQKSPDVLDALHMFLRQHTSLYPLYVQN